MAKQQLRNKQKYAKKVKETPESGKQKAAFFGAEMRCEYASLAAAVH
jgi:hypothetical protein